MTNASSTQKMPLIGYSTQIGPFTKNTQGSQATYRIIIVYHNDIRQFNVDLMKEAQHHLSDYANIDIISSSELEKRVPITKAIFVIPIDDFTSKLVSEIKTHAVQPYIYTDKCVVEALRDRKIALPLRSLATSTSMINCHVFVTKSCYDQQWMRRIFEMCGEISSKFTDPNLNVVVTNRADDKYCAKARQDSRNIAIVPKDWVDHVYDISRNTDEVYQLHEAWPPAWQIKPFLGLTFKLNSIHLNVEVRDLISNNGGKLVFGQSDGITHVVASSYQDDKAAGAPRVVDVEFLRACISEGHYMNLEEYRDYREKSKVAIKQERLSPTLQPSGMLQSQNCFTPPQQNPRSTLSSIRSNGYDRTNENQSMPPPAPSMPRQARHQGEGIMSDHIRMALMSFSNSTQQTQQNVSTQMRRLPEADIKFETTVESSQQLYWNDSFPKRR